MNENADVGNLFHDGSLVAIEGKPSKILLKIEIRYLREMFPGKGTSIFVKLDGCSQFEYVIWDSREAIKDYKRIVEIEPEILDVMQDHEIVRVICSRGELRLIYREISFSLDSGDEIMIDDLKNTSNQYWKDFGKT
jgi:hypothetical protein